MRLNNYIITIIVFLLTNPLVLSDVRVNTKVTPESVIIYPGDEVEFNLSFELDRSATELFVISTHYDFPDENTDLILSKESSEFRQNFPTGSQVDSVRVKAKSNPETLGRFSLRLKLTYEDSMEEIIVYDYAQITLAENPSPAQTQAPSKPKIVVLANSIDYANAQDFFGFLGNRGIEVVHSTASEFESYKSEKFVVILGGPDAPEGVGDIVSEVLGESEEEAIRESGSRKMYSKTNVWGQGQRVFVIAGSGRDQTKMAHEDNRDSVATDAGA